LISISGLPDVHPLILRAIHAALPVVAERAKAELKSNKLVRPASSPEDDAATLVRSVSGPGKHDSELLLRPGTDDETKSGWISRRPAQAKPCRGRIGLYNCDHANIAADAE